MQFKGEQACAYFEELVQGGPAGGGVNERGEVAGRVAQLEEEVQQRDKTIRELQVGGWGQWVRLVCVWLGFSSGHCISWVIPYFACTV